MKLLANLFMIITLVATSLSTGKDAWFVDSTLVYERGNQLSQQYLAKNAPGFSKQHEQILPWIVRVEFQHDITEESVTSNHGTGVILKGGLVLTAKHVMTEHIKDPSAETRIFLTTVDGRVFPASVVKSGKKDWVVLKMEIAPEQEAMLNSPIKIAKPAAKETCVFLGYPARLGIDKQGKVQAFHKGDLKNNIPVSQLNPMVVVGAVTDTEALYINPLAGFPPVGGMSGGPVFNLKGEVIAVQKAITKTADDATGKVLSYRIDATSSSDITLPTPNASTK